MSCITVVFFTEYYHTLLCTSDCLLHIHYHTLLCNIYCALTTMHCYTLLPCSGHALLCTTIHYTTMQLLYLAVYILQCNNTTTMHTYVYYAIVFIYAVYMLLYYYYYQKKYHAQYCVLLRTTTRGLLCTTIHYIMHYSYTVIPCTSYLRLQSRTAVTLLSTTVHYCAIPCTTVYYHTITCTTVL